MKIRSALTAMLLSSFAIAVALTPVMAKELVSVTIVGPGLDGKVKVTDPDQVGLFRDLRLSPVIKDKPDGVSIASFEDILMMAPVIEDKPDGLSTLFYEIRMAVGTADQIVAYNVYHYYPAQSDMSGFFYYADVIGGWSSAEGMWFALAEDSDRALREFLVSLGASSDLIEDNSAESSRLPVAPSQQSGIEPASEHPQVAPPSIGNRIASRFGSYKCAGSLSEEISSRWRISLMVCIQ